MAMSQAVRLKKTSEDPLVYSFECRNANCDKTPAGWLLHTVINNWEQAAAKIRCRKCGFGVKVSIGRTLYRSKKITHTGTGSITFKRS